MQTGGSSSHLVGMGLNLRKNYSFYRNMHISS